MYMCKTQVGPFDFPAASVHEKEDEMMMTREGRRTGAPVRRIETKR
jgi:hypothetical protein